MSVADVRMHRFLAAAFPEADTIARTQWQARNLAGPAPAPADTRPVCPTCGDPYRRNRLAPKHDYCSKTCRLRWQAQQRGGWKR